MSASSRHLNFKGVFALAIALLVLILAACSSSPLPFEGTALTPPQEANQFQLQDQFGQQVNLSDFKGKLVLLTFLYTNCPDVCPITTNQLRDAHEMLAEDADEVAFVAISVDPERDTIEAAHNFSERWKMTEKWSYLVGQEEELKPIWSSYYIDPAVPSSSQENRAQSTSHLPQPQGGVDALIQQSYLVIHSAPIYIIDQEGNMRVVFTLPFETEDLVHDVRLLLN